MSVPEKIFDKDLHFSDPRYTSPGMCHLIIWSDKTTMLCIVKEVDYNTGPSVTNAAETIATDVREKFAKYIKNFIWLEHYSYAHGRQTKSRFDLVEFEWKNGKAKSPSWKHIRNFNKFFNETFGISRYISIHKFKKLFFEKAFQFVNDETEFQLKEIFDEVIEELRNKNV